MVGRTKIKLNSTFFFVAHSVYVNFSDMPYFRKFLLLASFALLVGAAPLGAQPELKKMNEIRDGIIRLRQACLDSLHHSLAYIPEMRQTIETADVSAFEKESLRQFFLGDDRINGLDEIRNPRLRYRPAIQVSTTDYTNYIVNMPEYFELDAQKFQRLLNLKIKQTWPKKILTTLAQYGQLDKEYPHKLAVSNYFYGIFSFLNFGENDSIGFVSKATQAEVIAMVLGLYLKNGTIYSFNDSPYFLPNLIQNRLDEVMASGTQYKALSRAKYKFPEKNPRQRIKRAYAAEEQKLKNKIVVVDLYQAYGEKRYLQKLYHALTDDGELCMIETSKGLIRNDIRIEYLLPKGKIKRLAKRAGFELIDKEDLRVIRLFKFKKIPGKKFKI